MDTAVEALDARHEIGGNNPPGKLELEYAASVVAEAEAFIIECVEITDADMANQANNLIAHLKAAKKKLGAAQKSEIKPLDDAIDGIKAKYKEPIVEIDGVVTSLIDRAGAWLIKERDRIAAEKAAQEAEARRLREEAERKERERVEAARRLEEERRRLAAEEEERKRAAETEQQTELDRVAAETAAAAEQERLELERQDAARAAKEAEEASKAAKAAERAAEKKPETAAIKSGETGRRAMTLRSYWSAVIEDESAALDSYKDHPTVRKAALAAVLQAANEEARRVKDLDAAPPGIRFVHEERPV
ncbi:hypothetical protein [Reyranella massiliensis]|uniref:hypothetical protein n=1 Tax=Reyranella massiliensis TaxID=445220 RepID=UPI000309B5B6|nr:hypothetical protein [Reyranella massiliensis]